MGEASLRDLLAGPVVPAARGLLGMRLRSEIGGVHTEVVIVEAEAYGGGDDPASHAYRGPSERNSSMFGPPARAYIYRSYGVHWCLNVVTGPPGEGSAVLLRGGVPVVGEAVMRRRRGRSDHLADGPGKLCQALGVSGEHDGIGMLEGELRLVADDPPAGTVVATPRIGITRGRGHRWRFVLAWSVS